MGLDEVRTYSHKNPIDSKSTWGSFFITTFFLPSLPLNLQPPFIFPSPIIITNLVGESVEVPLPRELGVNETFGGQGLHGLYDFQVVDV